MAPRQAFVSFDKEDRRFVKALENHLATMRREKLIEVWHRDKATMGGEVEEQARAKLKAADFMIVLLSSDFLGSDDLVDEVTDAITGGLRVIPILAQPCVLAGTKLAPLKALPRDNRAVSLYSNQDQAWTEIVEAIRAFVMQSPEPKRSSAKPDAGSSPITASSSSSGMQSVLDATPFPWGHPSANKLHELLQLAYTVPSAEHLAQTVRIDLGHWDRSGGSFPAWKSLITIAVKQGKLRALVKKALEDQGVAGYHGQLQQAITPVELD